MFGKGNRITFSKLVTMKVSSHCQTTHMPAGQKPKRKSISMKDQCRPQDICCTRIQSIFSSIPKEKKFVESSRSCVPESHTMNSIFGRRRSSTRCLSMPWGCGANVPSRYCPESLKKQNVFQGLTIRPSLCPSHRDRHR